MARGWHAGGAGGGKNDPGFVYNGPLAGLVAVCAGSDLMHPLGALLTGGTGEVSFVSQLIGTAMGITIALVGGFVIYGVLKKTLGIRLDQEQEFQGADLALHRISATPDRD